MRKSGSLNCKVSYILVPFFLEGTDQPRPRGTFFMSGMRTSADQRRRQNSSSLSLHSSSLTLLNGHLQEMVLYRSMSLQPVLALEDLHSSNDIPQSSQNHNSQLRLAFRQSRPTRSRRKILIDVEEVTARLQSHLSQTVVTLANLQTEQLGSRQEQSQPCAAKLQKSGEILGFLK